MARHWSEKMTCTCGFSTYDVMKEARHRHNFPHLCRIKVKKTSIKRKKSVDTSSRSCQNTITER